MRYNRIPIFIPQMGCPHACVYCNQREITGFAHSLDPEDIYKIIDLHLASLSKESSVEIAFFGGNFTAIPWPLQQAYLQQSQKYIEKGLVSGIRFSTRPDDIQEFRLPIYKAYGVNTIELGAQSLNDRVLSLSGRGHSKAEVEIASEKIKQAGLRLGLQMMIGLPEDTLERALETASEIIRLKADETRIYPTLVIEHTLLAQWYRQGKYRPLPLEEAIE
ncbi:MAG: radical SAM protein, partial [Bacteroidales bacterium]